MDCGLSNTIPLTVVIVNISNLLGSSLWWTRKRRYRDPCEQKLVRLYFQNILIISCRNSWEKRQHRSSVHPQSMPPPLLNFILNSLYHLPRNGPSPSSKTTIVFNPHPHSTVLLQLHKTNSKHGSSHIVYQLLWS